MKRSILRLLAALSLFTVALAVQAQVAITPPIYDISLDGPTTTHAFRLLNYDKTAKHVRVRVINWTMDVDGKVSVIAPTEQSLQPWLQVNPIEFVLPPGGSQVVRFAVRPAVQLQPGEHRAMVFFDELRDATPSTSPATLKAYFRLGAAVYGHVGPVHRSGSIDEAKADASGVTFKVSNTGNATVRFDGDFAVWKAASHPGGEKAVPAGVEDKAFKAPEGMVAFGELPRDATLPGAMRYVRLRFGKLGSKPLAPGHYVLSMRGTLGSTSVSRELRFSVDKPRH